MLLRVSRNVARRSSRASAAVPAVDARRRFVQPSSSNYASVIDPPPPSVPDGEDMFRPRAGDRVPDFGSDNIFLTIYQTC